MARTTTQVAGSVYTLGKQGSASLVEATIASALALASVDARLALFASAGMPIYFAEPQVVKLAEGSEVYQGGRWSVKDITGTVSLPENAAKEEDGNLAALLAATVAAGEIPALGQQAMAASLPVTMASDQTTLYDINNRRLVEKQLIEAIDAGNFAMVRRSAERYTLTDRRGSAGRGSTR